MIPLLLITSAIIIFFSLKMEPLFRTVQQKLDRLNTVLQENISGARLVKAFVRAEYEGERFEITNQDLTDHTIRVMQFMSTMSPALTVFQIPGPMDWHPLKELMKYWIPFRK